MPHLKGCGKGSDSLRSAGLQRTYYPDPREDLESRSPNLGPYTTKGTLKEHPLRDLLFGSSRGSGYRALIIRIGFWGILLLS